MKIRIDPLDVQFSLYIRTKAGWKCECCRRQFYPPTAQLQNSHFHGRRKKSVRWDPENCAALCFSCHRRFTEHPLEHVEWFSKRLGVTRFNALTVKANSLTKPDKEMIRIWLKEKMKEIESESACQ